MLRLWINAFIPAHVPNYTRFVQGGKYDQKTGVPLPWIARPNPLNNYEPVTGIPLPAGTKPKPGFLNNAKRIIKNLDLKAKPLSTTYLGDQRSFSSNPAASVRIQTIAGVLVSRNPPRFRFVAMKPRTSGSVEVDYVTGRVFNEADANLGRCRWVEHQRRPGSSALHVVVQGAASDPLVSGAAFIDYHGRFVIDFVNGHLTVVFSGMVDAFPAFEAYASYGTSVQQLFQRPPPPGNTVMNLLGGAKYSVYGKAVF